LESSNSFKSINKDHGLAVGNLQIMRRGKMPKPDRQLEAEYASLLEGLPSMLESVEGEALSHLQSTTIPLLPPILNRKELHQVGPGTCILGNQSTMVGDTDELKCGSRSKPKYNLTFFLYL
jgi:hypothetical protein